MPIYLQDISIHIPLFFVLIASLMVLSMEKKWHYLLLVPLGLCLVGVWRLYQPFSQTASMYTKDLILTIVFATMFISVGLSPNSNNMYQVVMRGVIIVLMAFLSFLICFSSPIKNVYMRLLGFLFVFFLFIFCLTFIINDEKVLQKGLYVASVGIMSFFIFYYWRSMTVFLQQDKQQQQRRRKQRQQIPVMARMH